MALKPPRRVEKRKAARFSEQYFRENRRWFEEKFKSKSIAERSGMLAKLFRKAGFARKEIEKNLKRAEMLAESAKKGKIDMEKIEAVSMQSKKAFDGIIEDARKIYTREFRNRIGYGQSYYAGSQFMMDVHEAAHSLRKIKRIESLVKLLWRERNKGKQGIQP